MFQDGSVFIRFPVKNDVDAVPKADRVNAGKPISVSEQFTCLIETGVFPVSFQGFQGIFGK